MTFTPCLSAPTSVSELREILCLGVNLVAFNTFDFLRPFPLCSTSFQLSRVISLPCRSLHHVSLPCCRLSENDGQWCISFSVLMLQHLKHVRLTLLLSSPLPSSHPLIIIICLSFSIVSPNSANSGLALAQTWPRLARQKLAQLSACLVVAAPSRLMTHPPSEGAVLLYATLAPER